MKVKKTSSIPTELQSLKPFFHDIDLGNGYNTAPDTQRMKEMENLFFPTLINICGGNLKGKRVLDIGCNCGGFSFAANRFGAKEVIGIDSDENNIQQAEAVKKYLKVDGVNFIKMAAEEIDIDKMGEFDVTIMAGIIYHLSNPLSVIKKVSEVTKSVLLIDSHVHYSSNTSEEDIPSWWMLSDTDQNDFDGLFSNNEQLANEYLKFEQTRSVDYSKLTNQFTPSPITLRDMEFLKENIPNSAGEIRTDCNIGSAKPGQLVFIPNKKAIIKAVRHNGFEDVIEIIPHRFSSYPYLGKFRVGMIAIKRSQDGFFSQSIIHQKLTK